MVAGTLNSVGVQVEDRYKDRLPAGIPAHAAATRNDERLIGKTARITPLEPAEWPADVREWLDRSGSGRPVAAIYRTYARHLAMDKPRTAPIDSWMGTSNGRWDGAALVVDVTGFNDQTWFDRAGNFHSDALHVIERYSALDANTLRYEATIDDPNVFTRPWKISMLLYRRREPAAQLLEFKCVEFAEEMMYGHLRKGAKP